MWFYLETLDLRRHSANDAFILMFGRGSSRFSVFVLRSYVVGLLLSSGLWNVRRTDRHDTGETTNPLFSRPRDDNGRRAAASAFGRPGWTDVGDVASLRRKRLPRAHSLGVTGWEETACSNVTTPPCRGFIAPFFATVFHVKERLARRFGRCS